MALLGLFELSLWAYGKAGNDVVYLRPSVMFEGAFPNHFDMTGGSANHAEQAARDGAAHGHAVQHAWKREVVDVTSLAGNLGARFAPRKTDSAWRSENGPTTTACVAPLKS